MGHWIRFRVALLTVACVLLALRPTWAGDGGPPAGGDAYPVGIGVGDSFDVCRSGEVVCPARTAICDDPKVAVPVDLPGGLGFRGISPGTTLCSAASAVGPRRVFRITVR